MKNHLVLVDLQHPDGVTSMTNQANGYRNQNRYGEAESLYKRALAIREKAFGTDHPSLAGSLHNLAWLYDTHGQYANAKPLYERALAIRERDLDPSHHHLVCTSLSCLAGLYMKQGQRLQAAALHRRMRAVWEKHPKAGLRLDAVAQLFMLQCRYTEAEPLLKSGLAFREKCLGQDHLDVATSLENLAEVYRKTDRERAAEVLVARAATIRAVQP
jgi:tetratricopeptide (TPR) repeat protein